MADVDRTGVVIPIADATYSDVQFSAGNCLRTAVGMKLGPVNFIWGSRWTCFFKAKMNSVALGSSRLIEGTSGQGIILTLTGIKVQVPSGSATSSSILIANEWHDYAIVYDGAFARFSRDGAPVSAKTMTANPITSEDSFTIFNRSDLIRECDMDVCEFQWYNRAFDPVQVAAHYRSDPDNINGLVLRYKLQEGTGTSILDYSHNRNDTTLTGGSWQTFTLTAADYYNGISTYGSLPLYEPSIWTKENPSSATWTKEIPYDG